MSISLRWAVGYDRAPVKLQTADSAPDWRIADDVFLVARARDGEMAAFEELVRRYRNDVYAISFHLLRHREEAWDCAQEAFIKAYRSLGSFRGDAGFKTWLLRIGANHAKDMIKKRRVPTVAFDDGLENDPPAGAQAPDAAIENKELGQAIEEAIAALPEIHRTAFVLREYQGLSYQEIAEVMGCNLGTVMSRLHHARRKLQTALLNRGVVEGDVP